MIQVKQGEYKGKPVLEFWEQDAKPDTYQAKVPVLSFGVKKARILFDHMEDVRQFLLNHEPKGE